MSEEVLCVPTKVFRDCGYFTGFMPICSDYLPLFAGAVQTFQPRSAVEDDPKFKQLIPYIIVERGGGGLVLNYYRGKGQGEQRLHGLRSIGIGGHINPCDLDDTAIGILKEREAFLDDRYVRGMLRELNEEVQFHPKQPVWDLKVVGLINEDGTDVGKVHLGVVHLLHVDFGVSCTPGEDDMVDLDWTPYADPGLETMLKTNGQQFELWSQICIEHVDPRRQSPKKQLRGEADAGILPGTSLPG